VKRCSLKGVLVVCTVLTSVLLAPAAPAMADPPADGTMITWGSQYTVHDEPQFTDAGADAQGLRPGRFGAEFPRMLKTGTNTWLAVYTIYNNNGYTKDANGGMRLQVARSTDNARTWTIISNLSDPGRDIDNGQMVQLADGSILLAYRSVRWAESYRLEVLRSTDGGANWTYRSRIDSNEGSPGSLYNPQKGVYEPYMLVYPNGDIGVMYANEKHVVETPSYSQIISLKISTDAGSSWGPEIYAAWDPASQGSRPGMPVWTRMANGNYILAFEVCGTYNCNAYVKTSSDGRTWSSGIGAQVPAQNTAPYVLSLSDGRLVLTSGSHEVSVSRDYGATWFLNDTNAYNTSASLENLWPAMVQTGTNEIGFITSVKRDPNIANNQTPGHIVKIRFGTWQSLSQSSLSSGSYYTLAAQHTGMALDVDAGSAANGAKVQQWPINGLPPQRWRLDAQGDGSYVLVNQQSLKVLDVDANSTANFAKVQQWEPTGCACQRWKLDYLGSGLYRVAAAHSNKLLDVTAGSSVAGTAVQQYEDIGARPQRWKIFS
jgi:hypothetical protein